MNESLEKEEINKIETKEDALEIIDQDGWELIKEEKEKIESFNSKVLNIETEQQERIGNLNKTIGLSEDKLDEIKQDFSLKEKLENIKEKAKNLSGELKEKLKIVTAVGTMLIALSSGVEVSAWEAGKGEPRTILELQTSSAISKERSRENIERKEKDRYDSLIYRLNKQALTDKKESSVIIYEENGEMIIKETVGNKAYVFFEVDEIEKGIKGTKDVQIIHTHPLEACHSAQIFSICSGENIEKVRNGEIEPNPMPPSMTDIISAINLSREFGDKIKNKVVDTTGIWEFSIDKDNDFIKRMSEYQKEMINIADNFSEKKLNEDERKILQDTMEKTGTADINYLIVELKKDQKTSALGDKMMDFLDKRIDKFVKIIPREEIEDFISINSLGLDIISFNEDNKDKKGLIDKYIKINKKRGINVSYKPLGKKKEN